VGLPFFRREWDERNWDEASSLKLVTTRTAEREAEIGKIYHFGVFVTSYKDAVSVYSFGGGKSGSIHCI